MPGPVRVPYKKGVGTEAELVYVAGEERDLAGDDAVFQVMVTPAMSIQVDDTGAGGVSYVGEAEPGTGAAAAAWRIKKVTETGADVVVQYADGDALFDNVWSDRASLTYS